ncbi:MAG: M48 family metalloprotease [Kiritimatiellia bacterium]|jgi:predicted Zn-dependent protease|nr:M48 family metalloprotease [Kiritimatiellia bacterium]MDP6630218.1 M48 family metalloprotease [Kiritimatiellia bacterium]MDP6810694.1 M48 family metalloprotease [Kiritimatiellia bacterium]MDP7023319.1 M48 family metalloprotease [Kiritimatiellia bacterium]
MTATRSALSRRQFIGLSGATAAVTVVGGCATNPVTGRRQLMFLSESAEISMDKERAPHQFSADYGALQDARLAQYVSEVGSKLAVKTHRPDMPYDFQSLNASYVNAYTFPGGSMAVTRGILLGMENEAELAAVLGHELGHVNARHTAQRMTKGLLSQAIVAGVTMYIAEEHEKYASLAYGLGGIGAGALLARYSRGNEREADALGMEYMTQAGYSPQGMVGLMDMLNGLHKRKPDLLQRMFSSHPMSSERYADAMAAMNGKYNVARSLLLGRERYMDMTAGLRKIEGAIKLLQDGDLAMMKQKFDQALVAYTGALRIAPKDYAGLLSMAKCQMALGKKKEAQRFVERAQSVYPGEPHAVHVAGMVSLASRQFAAAHAAFAAYDKALPGNPSTAFHDGTALEGMGRKEDAARRYAHYLRATQQGKEARHAHQRLIDWGYIKPAPAGHAE